MRSSKRIVTAAVVAVASQIALTNSVSHAATITWDGGAATDNLSLAANWAGDVLPAATDDVVFTGAEGLNPLVDVPTLYKSLTFNAAAGAFTFSGGNTLTLGTSPATAGNLSAAASTVTQTFNNNVATYGGTVTSGTTAAGQLVFGGTFNVGNGGFAAGNNVTFTGTGNITINGGIAGSGTTAGGNITKTGTSTLFVNAAAASSFNANVNINGGAIRISNGDALGTAQTGGAQINTSLSSGGTGQGTLELTNNITVNKVVQVGGRADASVAAIRNISGNNTVANVSGITGGAFHNFVSDSGLLTISNYTLGTVVTSARTASLGGAGDGRIDNWTLAAANVAHNVVKSGTGTWTLGANLGTVSNNIGTVTVNGGTLFLEGNLGQKVAGNVVVASGGTIKAGTTDGGTGEIGVYNGTTTNTLTIQAGGTLDATQFSTYSLPQAQTFIGGGTVKTGGTFKTYGDNAIYIGNSTAPAAGTLNIVGDYSITNEAATATGGMRFDLGTNTTVGGGVNDLISVTGNLQVNNGFGAIPLYINPFQGSLQTGTYRLIEFGSGATPNASDFTIVGSSAGTTRQSFSVGTAPGQVNLVVTGTNANLVWKGDGAGNAWDVLTTPNFLNGTTADRFYQFDNVTFNDTTANRTVNLTGELLPSTVTVDTANAYVFQGSGFINGAAILNKNGSGTLTIANTTANTYTGTTTINAGTLQLGNGGADGTLGTGAVVNNGTLIYNKNVATTASLTSGTGNVIVRGAGPMTFDGVSTYTGTTTLEAGSTSFLRNGAALGDAAGGTIVQSGATLYTTVALTSAEPLTLNGDGATAAIGALRGGGSALATFTGPVTLGSATTINMDGGATIDLTGNVGGTGDLLKVGSGTLNLSGAANTYVGATNVTAGTLNVGNGAAVGSLPSGSVVSVGTGATLRFGSSGTLSLGNTITGVGTVTQGNAGGTTTLTGDLTGFTGTIATQTSAAVPGAPGAAVNGTLILAGPTNAATATVSDSGQGNGQGVLRITNSAALPATATINVQAQQAVGNGRLELGNNVNVNVATINLNQRNLVGVADVNGFNNTTATQLTPAIRSTDGVNSIGGNITVTTGGTFAGIEAAAGSTLTVNGTIVPLATAGSPRNLVLMGAGTGVVNSAINLNTQTINVLKTGTGTWTLNGANTYTGRTSVLGGDLIVSTAARASVLPSAPAAGQFTDIQGGRVLFQYADASDGASVANQAQTILAAGYGQTPKFSDGQIRSSTLDATHLLGSYNDTAHSRVIVGYTIAGDTNVDLTVNFDDLLNLAKNYNGTNKVWGQGDVNYDSTVNFDDLLALAKNYNKSALSGTETQVVGSAFAADFALAQSMVPEPATLSALGMGAYALLGRRRKAVAAAR